MTYAKIAVAGLALAVAVSAVAQDQADKAAWIQLFNLAGDPLSEKIYLTTHDDCLKNLILMNFSEQ